ncbi:hypothetical protein [Fictibacillus barbaricus]|uniref:DUF4021 domain-containing protein n=1 Tax=Fictibacillus barbaricus TaxID=182136 RepID=A0ABS2Z9W8_9BACL|nr:hypothetical protein [Fictibacillus barbaricus]MBN3544957.1 hypothetical protein [Fictibacillus barbaricus]GGB62799.1 hypothetical protein GCM10007199_30970 [Fictibacillus barbaricus]
MENDTTKPNIKRPQNAQHIDELFGLEPMMSLQSVNYATSGNQYLTEQTESED